MTQPKDRDMKFGIEGRRECIDYRKRKNKKFEEYGWNVAAYCAPEHIWRYDTVTATYNEDLKVSWQRIVDHIHDIYPIVNDKKIRKVHK